MTNIKKADFYITKELNLEGLHDHYDTLVIKGIFPNAETAVEKLFQRGYVMSSITDIADMDWEENWDKDCESYDDCIGWWRGLLKNAEIVMKQSRKNRTYIVTINPAKWGFN